LAPYGPTVSLSSGGDHGGEGARGAHGWGDRGALPASRTTGCILPI